QRQADVGQTIFTVPNLDALRKGGRIPALPGLLGQLLQVRPVMHLKDGAIELLDRPRSQAKALALITEIANSAETPVRLSVQASVASDTPHELEAAVDQRSPTPVPVQRVPAVLAAHLGVLALGISMSPALDYAGYGRPSTTRWKVF